MKTLLLAKARDSVEHVLALVKLVLELRLDAEPVWMGIRLTAGNV